jgi:hypothetical protein
LKGLLAPTSDSNVVTKAASKPLTLAGPSMVPDATPAQQTEAQKALDDLNALSDDASFDDIMQALMDEDIKAASPKPSTDLTDDEVEDILKNLLDSP